MTPTATPEMQEAQELLSRAMKLPPELRERIGRELVDSVDPPPNSDWAYWKAEIARRIEAVDSGAVKALTLEEAMAQIRKDRKGRQP